MKYLLLIILTSASLLSYSQISDDSDIALGKQNLAEMKAIVMESKCPVAGSGKGKDVHLDSLKNRSEIPMKYKEYPFDQLAAMKVTDTLTGAISFTGYCILVKDGGPETCNCKSKDKQYWDAHIELTKDSSHTSNKDALIVEINWRTRQAMAAKGIDWSTKTLKKQLTSHTVRVGGLPFFDSHHWQNSIADNPDGDDDWRATALEVHPVTYIEIIQ